jgi:hypothetical protein
VVFILLSWYAADPFSRYCYLGTAWCGEDLGDFVDIEVCSESLKVVSLEITKEIGLGIL